MSTLKVNSIEPANAGSEDYFLARAWVTYSGVTTTSITADGNVSSLTDHGTGDTTIGFSTALQHANYSISGSCRRQTANELLMIDLPAVGRGYGDPSTSGCRIISRFTHTYALDDAARNSVTVTA